MKIVANLSKLNGVFIIMLLGLLAGCSNSDKGVKELTALVEDGYSCDNMQCGFITFSKSIKDTTWYVGVEVFCDTLSTPPKRMILLDEEEVGVNAEIEDIPIPRFSDKAFSEVIKKNPYFPFKLDEIRDCEISLHSSGVRVASTSLTFQKVEELVQSKGYTIHILNPQDSLDFGRNFKLFDDADQQISSGSFWRTIDHPIDSNIWIVKFSNAEVLRDSQ